MIRDSLEPAVAKPTPETLEVPFWEVLFLAVTPINLMATIVFRQIKCRATMIRREDNATEVRNVVLMNVRSVYHQHVRRCCLKYLESLIQPIAIDITLIGGFVDSD